MRSNRRVDDLLRMALKLGWVTRDREGVYHWALGNVRGQHTTLPGNTGERDREPTPRSEKSR